jgi:hypothetical protein
MVVFRRFPKNRVINDTSHPDHSMYPVEDNSNRMKFYPDLFTKRTITGILVMLNNRPIRWGSKCQKTVEKSAYDSELVSSRIAMKLILEVRYMLRSLAAVFDSPSSILGDTN